MVTKMKQKLYVPIRRYSLRYSYYFYFDTKEYLADQLFIRHKVRVWYGKEFARPDSPYRFIFCHVRKQDVPEFLAALEELKKSMLICGYTDYESEVSNMLEKLDQIKDGDEIDENDPPIETKQSKTA